MQRIDILFDIFDVTKKIYQFCKLKKKCWHHRWRQHHKRCHAWPTRGGHVAEQCQCSRCYFRISIFMDPCSWTKVTHVDKFREHFFTFASSWTKVAHADKFRDLFFAFASSWTKMAQSDKLKDCMCILLFKKSTALRDEGSNPAGRRSLHRWATWTYRPLRKSCMPIIE